MEDQSKLEEELARLKQDHQDLSDAVDALIETKRADALQIQRLKKKKLALKDRIIQIEALLFPDIIA